MSILFVTHYAGFYGANRSLLTLMLLLRERYGIQPIVLLPSQGPMSEALQRENIHYNVTHYYWWVNENHGVFQWLLNKRKQWRNQLRVKKILRLLHNEQIDLVYSNSVCVNMGIFLAEKLAVPHIWQFRESMTQFRLSLSLSLSLSLLRRKVNRKFILISDYMMQEYAHLLPAERMVRIYNGLPQVTEMPQKPATDVLHLCMVGVVCEQKNQLDAVQAIALLSPEERKYVCLHIIGSHKEDYQQQIVDYVAQYHLEEQVILHGHQDNVSKWLQQMHIGLMCSRDEAFGRVTIEYMQAAMPVIASRSGANEELVHEGVNGYLYDLHCPEQLAAHLRHFIQQPNEVTALGASAFQYAKQFTAERNAEEIYEQIIQITHCKNSQS